MYTSSQVLCTAAFPSWDWRAFHRQEVRARHDINVEPEVTTPVVLLTSFANRFPEDTVCETSWKPHKYRHIRLYIDVTFGLHFLLVERTKIPKWETIPVMLYTLVQSQGTEIRVCNILFVTISIWYNEILHYTIEFFWSIVVISLGERMTHLEYHWRI